MLFSQIPFLPLVDSQSTQELTAALARIVPILVPSSLAQEQNLPSTAEYYILDDTKLSIEKAIEYLDKGATRLVSKNPSFLAQIPSDRFILHLDDASDVSVLASTELLSNPPRNPFDLSTSSFSPLLEVLNKSLLNLHASNSSQNQSRALLSSLLPFFRPLSAICTPLTPMTANSVSPHYTQPL